MARQAKKIAVFDIDGTIFRSTLLIELTEELIEQGIFPKSARTKYAQEYKRWLERKDSYEVYIMAVVRSFVKNIRGVDRARFLRVARGVAAFHQSRVYRYTRDLVQELRRQGYYIVAISNSPREIVQEFCKKHGFDLAYGRIYEIDDDNKFTGGIRHLELVSDKAKMLRRIILEKGLSLTGSVGVGDTESDVAFLRMVERPICFNPNRKLYRHAKRKGWKIVVERKDVIYHLE